MIDTIFDDEILFHSYVDGLDMLILDQKKSDEHVEKVLYRIWLLRDRIHEKYIQIHVEYLYQRISRQAI